MGAPATSNVTQMPRGSSSGGRRVLPVESGVVALMTAGIVVTRVQGYLLFHSLAETFSIVIGLTVFSIAWNTRRALDSPFLLVIGLVSGPTALVDLVHTLAFKGMGVFPGGGADLPTQLWVAGRTVEVAGVATAVLIGARRPRAGVVLASVSGLAAALIVSIFVWKVFPACFVDGRGLTPFKRGSEYVFVAVLLVAFGYLRRRRGAIAPTVYPYLTGAVLLLAVEESCFAFYTDVYGVLNMAGHVAKISAFYLIYSGVVRFGFTEPQESLFHSLSDLNRRLSASAEQLRASQEWLQRLTDNLSEAVIVVAEDGIVRFANPAAVRLLSGDADPVNAEGACRIDDHLRVRGAAGERVLSASPFWAHLTAHGQAETDDLVVVLPGGRTLEVSCCGSVMPDGRRGRQMVLSLRDMSTLNQARRQAAQAAHLAAIGRLAAGVAHEINNPAQYVGDNLDFIAGGVRLLSSAVGDAAADPGLSGATHHALASSEVREMLTELPQAVAESRDGLDQIIRIVKSLREFSHPGVVEHAATDVNHVIEASLMVSHNVWKGVARVELHLDPALPSVMSRAGELNQVFVNLIVNAAQAIQSSGKTLPGRITISTALRDEAVEIRVCDTGQGVPNSIRDRIFDLFFTTRPNGQGTGQGLALCRDVVTVKHGGTIELESTEGEGSTFIVRLPRISSGSDQTRRSA